MTEMQAEEVCGSASSLSHIASSCPGLTWRRGGELSLSLVRRIQSSSLPGVPPPQLHLLILSDGGSGGGGDEHPAHVSVAMTCQSEFLSYSRGTW